MEIYSRNFSSATWV